MLEIKSNKDAVSGDRGTMFSSRQPGTYSILVDGVRVGEIETVGNYPMERINPKWGGRESVWVAYIYGTEVSADPYLANVKAALKSEADLRKKVEKLHSAP